MSRTIARLSSAAALLASIAAAAPTAHQPVRGARISLAVSMAAAT